MKKMFLLLMLLTVSMSFAQLKKVESSESEVIGRVQPFGLPMEAECTKTENIYTIKFKDKQFTTINEYRSFSFTDSDNTFNDLYAAIDEGFKKNATDETIHLELPDYNLSLRFTKGMGIQSLSISYSKKNSDLVFSSNFLTKKQVEKLFGKKK